MAPVPERVLPATNGSTHHNIITAIQTEFEGCANEPLVCTMSTPSSFESEHKNVSMVSFSDVSVREFEVFPSDSPSVSVGAGIQVRGILILCQHVTCICGSNARSMAE